MPYRLALRAAGQHLRRVHSSSQHGGSQSTHRRDAPQIDRGRSIRAARRRPFFRSVRPSVGYGPTLVLPEVDDVRNQVQIVSVSNTDMSNVFCDYPPIMDNDRQLVEDPAVFAARMESQLQLNGQKELALTLAALPRVEQAVECECAICLELLSTSGKGRHQDMGASCRLPCGHAFHETCLGSWFLQSHHGRTCPLCREEIFATAATCNVSHSSSSSGSSQSSHSNSGAGDFGMRSRTVSDRMQSRFQDQQTTNISAVNLRFPWQTTLSGPVARMTLQGLS